MKTIVFSLIALTVLTIGLVGCSNSSLPEKPSSPENDMNKSPEYVLGFRSADSAKKAREICSFVKGILGDCNVPTTVYCDVGAKAGLLIIYGIESRDAQNDIMRKIEEEKKLKGWKTIFVEFRRQEIWEKGANGFNVRGNEEILLWKEI